MFDPYGKVTVLDGNAQNTRTESAYGNPWTFTGRRLDQETGLMQYRKRMFDTGLGRFIGRDPVGYRGGWGLQHYVNNAAPRFVDPMGTYKKECYDNPMRQEQCPQNGKEPGSGCDPIKVAFYFDERTEEVKAVEKEQEEIKGGAKLSDAEHSLRFGSAVSGGNAIGVSAFKDLGEKGGDKCKGCWCIKKLWIIGHGSGAGMTVVGAGGRGFRLMQTGSALKGDFTFSQLGKVIEPMLCKNADIYIISCHTGNDKGKSGEEVVVETGGTVHTYEGAWDTCTAGSYTPELDKAQGDRAGKPGHREMGSSIGADGKPRTAHTADWRPNASQW
jgi:RHS repeat-associated protein